MFPLVSAWSRLAVIGQLSMPSDTPSLSVSRAGGVQSSVKLPAAVRICVPSVEGQSNTSLIPWIDVADVSLPHAM